MPTSGTGTSSSNAVRAALLLRRGFTLIELAIVVFIISLMAAAAIVTFSGERQDEQLIKEAERLDALFDYVREQAELQTRDYGFRINRKTYSFVVFDVLADQWRPADEDDALRAREIPEGILPTVIVEGRTVVLDVKKKEVEDFTPQVLVFANGDLSSFEVKLERGGEVARVYTDEQTNIKLLRPGEVEQPTVRTVRK
jgi:type II secretion system protein H